MQGALLLDVVVAEGAAILKLLSSKDQALLIRGDSLLVLNLLLDIIDRVRGLDIKGDSLPCQRLDEDLVALKGYGGAITVLGINDAHKPLKPLAHQPVLFPQISSPFSYSRLAPYFTTSATRFTSDCSGGIKIFGLVRAAIYDLYSVICSGRTVGTLERGSHVNLNTFICNGSRKRNNIRTCGSLNFGSLLE